MTHMLHLRWETMTLERPTSTVRDQFGRAVTTTTTHQVEAARFAPKLGEETRTGTTGSAIMYVRGDIKPGHKDTLVTAAGLRFFVNGAIKVWHPAMPVIHGAYRAECTAVAADA